MRRFALSAVIVFCVAAVAGAQSQGQPPSQPKAQPSSAPVSAASLTVLVDQLIELFPRVDGEIVDVKGDSVTLDVGRKHGVHVGLELEIFREGAEIKHPRTGQVLGREEKTLGRVRVTGVQETLSTAAIVQGADIKPADRFRTAAGKVNLVLLPLLGGVRETLVEAATQELVERLSQTGRFRVTMGDTINVFLGEQGLKAEDFLAGRGVKQAAEKFKVEHILAIHFKRVQNKPFMDVRFFSLPQADPAITMAFFVPATIKPSGTTGRFSQGGPANPPQAKPRSLLARLLGGDLEAGSYSSGEGSIPLRQVARFNFPVLAMDIAVSPKDKIPRMAVSDGDQVYMYKIVEQRFEPEWSKSVRSLGRVFSLQLADLNGDGNLEVIGNRYDPRTSLSGFILTQKDGKPTMAVENIEDFLFAVDLKGDGVKQTLWTQKFSPEAFFTSGQASQVVLKNGKLLVEKPVRVPSTFRPMGAAFSNVMGKESRALAFIDDYNRLQVVDDTGAELWRSATVVGGGAAQIELITGTARNQRSRFLKIEPTPLAVDLDGDGVEELVVPQNLVKEGLLAVVFKGPAGFRLQSINTGFEGLITCLGAFKTEDTTQPTVIASVVRFSNFLRTSGETQIIMTMPQE